MYRRPIIVVLMVLAHSRVADGADGQPSPAAPDSSADITADDLSSDDAVERAKDAFEQGLEAFKGDKLDAACTLFRQSYELDSLPGVFFTWATCEVRAGRAATGYGPLPELPENGEELARGPANTPRRAGARC